jgi:hypothetical protein
MTEPFRWKERAIPIHFILPEWERDWEREVRSMAIGFDYLLNRYILPIPTTVVDVDPAEYRPTEINHNSSFGAGR